jgi:DNA-binding CsgD family transcriptional regulator/tetratricopeptide (TPR) repeat protein
MSIARPAQGLFGREPELAILAAAHAQVRQGRSRVIVVTAEAGYGKTELVGHATDLAGSDLTVLRGGCVSITGTAMKNPYGPFVEALRQVPESAAAYSRARRWLRPVHEESSAPVEDRQEEFLSILAALAKQRQVTLVLEDMQWADRSSLELLVFVARNISTERVLLIVTTRGADAPVDQFRDGILDSLRRLPNCDSLTLDGMVESALADLARAAGANSAQAAEIARRAGGSPLFAKEMAEACGRGRPIDVPPSIRDAVRARYDALTGNAREMVDLAAVAGSDVTWRLLATLLADQQAAPDLDRAFEDANNARLLTPDGRFRHELERKAVYDRVPPGRRARWHERVARELQHDLDLRGEAVAEQLAQVAAHWALSPDRSAATASALRAGYAARDVSAFPEALDHLTDGLQQWRLLTADPPGWEGRQAEVVGEAAACTRWLGKPERGLEMLQDAVRRATGRPAALLWARIGQFEREMGNGRAALDAYTKALAVPAEDLTDADRARVHAGYAALLMTRFDFQQAREHCAAALTAAGEGRSATRANALTTLGVIEFMTGDHAGGLELLERSGATAKAVRSEDEYWRYVGNKIFCLLNVGRVEDAVSLAKAEVDGAREAGVHRSAAVLHAWNNAVSGMVMLGRWSEALEYASEALEGEPSPGLAASLHIEMAEVYTLRGEWELARAELDMAERDAGSVGEPEITGRIFRIRAELAVLELDRESALRNVYAGLDAVPPADPDSRIQLIKVALHAEADAIRRSRKATSRTIVQLERRLNDEAKRLVDPLERNAWTGITVRTSRLEAARARREDRAADWQRLAREWDGAGNPYLAAYALLREAEAYPRTAHRRVAITRALTGAAGHAAVLGARPLADTIAEVARNRRLTLADAPAADPGPPLPRATTEFQLTRQEVVVLRELVSGGSNHEIAVALGTKIRTVTTQLTSIYGKLGVNGREAAVKMVRVRRLLEPEG